MTRLLWIPRRGAFAAAVLVLLLGCNRGNQSPLERARYLCSHSEFEAALKVCDEAIESIEEPQAIGSTEERQELADLHLMRGRCFVEQAHRLEAVEQDDLATAKLKKAVAEFTNSIKLAADAEAHYYRSLAYRMMGNEELALKDGAVARVLDETYSMAYINEPSEEPLDFLRADEDKNETAAADAQASSGQSWATDTDDSGPDAESFDLTNSATDESEEATIGTGPVVTRNPAASISGLQRPSPGSQTSKSEKEGTTAYRGRPAAAGELSTAVPRTPTDSQTDAAQPFARRGTATGRTFAGGSGFGQRQEGPEIQAEDQEEAEGATGDSSDAPSDEENGPDEPTESPRPRTIWPPPVGPWSTTPQPLAMPLPTTGLGGTPVWGSTPYSAGVPLQQVPTTGIVGRPVQRPLWTTGMAGVGASANPFTPPATGIGRIAWPPTQAAPGVPFAPAPSVSAPTPATRRPNVGSQGPVVGPESARSLTPTVPVQSLPTTGAQRSVSPYPQ